MSALATTPPARLFTMPPRTQAPDFETISFLSRTRPSGTQESRCLYLSIVPDQTSNPGGTMGRYGRNHFYYRYSILSLRYGGSAGSVDRTSRHHASIQGATLYTSYNLGFIASCCCLSVLTNPSIAFFCCCIAAPGGRGPHGYPEATWNSLPVVSCLYAPRRYTRPRYEGEKRWRRPNGW